MIGIKNKKFVVLGAARSGLAVAELLTKNGLKVFISDIASVENKKEEIKKLQLLGIPFEFGRHSDKIFNADLVVISPGIATSNDQIKRYNELKIPIYSELEVASWFNKASIIAITGSNGKTTTVSLIADIFSNERPETIVAGNIGTPFSSQVEHTKKDRWAILEVSSFQLEAIDTFHPKISLILNLSPNHLDRYPTYEAYIKTKLNIIRNLVTDDILIYNRDDRILKEKLESCPAKKITFSLNNKKADAYLCDHQLVMFNNKLINCEEIALKGDHNYMNAMAASLAAKCAGIQINSLLRTLKNFRGVEHRLEYVTSLDGIDIINDSKSTTIESLAVALSSFTNPIILIAGGKDKGGDFSKLNNILIKKTKMIILIGEAKNNIAAIWRRTGIPIYLKNTLASAVEKALSSALTGDLILLSPACASFDMFQNFEDRGRQFKQIVLKQINLMRRNEKTGK